MKGPDNESATEGLCRYWWSADYLDYDDANNSNKIYIQRGWVQGKRNFNSYEDWTSNC